jgi:hypothetical protein
MAASNTIRVFALSWSPSYEKAVASARRITTREGGKVYVDWSSRYKRWIVWNMADGSKHETAKQVFGDRYMETVVSEGKTVGGYRPNPSKSSCKSYVSKQIRRQYREGKVGRGKGKRSREQAIAIAFSKARTHGCKVPQRNPKHFAPGDIVRHTAKWRRSVGMYAGGPINGVVLGQHQTIPEWVFVAWSDGHGTWVAKANIERIASKKRVGTAELAALSKQYHAKIHEKNPKAAAKRNPQPSSTVDTTARRLMRP